MTSYNQLLNLGCVAKKFEDADDFGDCGCESVSLLMECFEYVEETVQVFKIKELGEVCFKYFLLFIIELRDVG